MKSTIATLIFVWLSLSTIGQELQQCQPGDFTIQKTDPSCYDYSDGSITIFSPYIGMLNFQLYSLDEGRLIRDFTNDEEFSFLKAGKYRIIAVDTLGASCYSDVQIHSPNQIILLKENISSTRPHKDKSDGSVTVYFSGGVPPYTLIFNKTDNILPQQIFIGNATSKIVDGLSSGIYTILVQDSKYCQSLGIQYELSNKDNFDYSIIQNPKTCDSLGLFKIFMSNSQMPFEIQVKFNDQIIVTKSSYMQNEYQVALNAYGIYELTLQDKRRIPVTIQYVYQDINCNLSVSTQVIEKPNIHNSSNGKILISINDGHPPYSIKCTNQLTYESNAEQTTNSKNHVFSNLKEGNYSITVVDKDGRKFEATISMPSNIPSNEEAYNEYLKDKDIFYKNLKTYECNIKRLENTQKIIRVSVSLIGFVGTVASAGAGTIVGGLISGIITTGGTLTNEFSYDKKLSSLKNNYLIYKNIEALYGKFTDLNFSSANWTTDKYKEYELFKNQIEAQKVNLDKEILPYCHPSKLEKWLNRTPAR